MDALKEVWKLRRNRTSSKRLNLMVPGFVVWLVLSVVVLDKSKVALAENGYKLGGDPMAG
jgi:hypothetical protein